MPRKKISTTVYLEPEQVEGLKQLAAMTRVPMAEWVRMGLEYVLAQSRPDPFALIRKPAPPVARILP